MSSDLIEGRRPPLRPRASAALSPALVRSRMIERSNCANAPKIWKTNSRAGVVVSIASVNAVETDLARFELVDGLDKLFYGTGETVEFPDHQDVAGARVVEDRL